MKSLADIPNRGPLSNRRVMLADNHKSKFNPLLSAFETAHIDVYQCDDRAKVVQEAVAFQPDLIIINLFMNTGNTLGIIRELKEALQARGTKILVITTHQSKQNLLECIKSGASDFIVEPFEPTLLIQRVKYQLQERETYTPDDLVSEPTQIEAGFQLIYNSLRILAEVKEVNRSIHEVLKRVAELSQSTRVNLMLADFESAQAIVIASSDDPNLHNFITDIEKYPEVREVLLNDCILYVKDITANPLTKDIKNAVKTIEINSLLVFPVRHRQETIGTLSIRLGKEGLAISEQHLKTFYMLALAIAPKVAARRLLKKFQDAPKPPTAL